MPDHASRLEWLAERVAIILESEPQTPVAEAEARAEAMWEAWCQSAP